MSTPTDPTDDLATYVASAKEHGIADEFLATLLRRNGWSEQRIYGAFSQYYAGVVGVALPRGGGSAENARDAFLYLINFITLGFWSVALGHIFYIFIAQRFPDAAAPWDNGGTLSHQIAWQLATVIITFPIFAFVHSRIVRELRKRRELYASGVRKWLTYIALVGALLIVVGDGIWFLQALLLGELTVRFILDSLVLLVLGGGIFWYYMATINAPKEAAT